MLVLADELEFTQFPEGKVRRTNGALFVHLAHLNERQPVLQRHEYKLEELILIQFGLARIDRQLGEPQKGEVPLIDVAAVQCNAIRTAESDDIPEGNAGFLGEFSGSAQAHVAVVCFPQYARRRGKGNGEGTVLEFANDRHQISRQQTECRCPGFEGGSEASGMHPLY